ncbi:hypothetical protein [Methylocystis parvus]|uniref:Capsid assembly protein n=1 Tax=Methylocystis parvus TaxID=134 RepID=A0A6B8M5T0_9HYPH|nr:hypothetical protein [Methylocystis parvus]QGM97705.1 hypothetical protein F7D14_09650 [Methylocystis parvus]WBJ98360.1 hypothetical protein MMG94_09940 [Methylocystis parvus OBBP]
MSHEEAHNIAEMKGLTDEERAALTESDAPAPAADEEATAESVEFRADPAPILNVRAPENASAVLDRVSQFENDVERRFYDGEITSHEYRDGLRQAAEAREEVRWSQRKADLAREMDEQAKEAAWFREVDRFLSTTGAAVAKNDMTKTAFDQYVKEVTADPTNQHLSDRAQLEKAHKLFVADFGPAFGTPAAHQPSGEGERGDLGGGKFATLDRLAESDPMGYERALAKMSDAEQAEYLRSA